MTTTTPAPTETTKFFADDQHWFDVTNTLLTQDGGRMNEAITLVRGVIKASIEGSGKDVEELLAEGAPVKVRDKYLLLHDRLGNALYFAEKLQQDDLDNYDKDILQECIHMKGMVDAFNNKILGILFCTQAAEQLVKYFEGFEEYAMRMLKEEKVTVEQAVQWATHAREQVTRAKALEFHLTDASNLFDKEMEKMIEGFDAMEAKKQEEEMDDTDGKLDDLLKQI